MSRRRHAAARWITAPMLAAAVCAGAHASVRVVDASGAGAYTAIQPAVDAASDGDVILVKSGMYAGFAISNKALDVVADAGATVQLQGFVAVSGLTATRAVTLTALVIEPLTPGAALRLNGNAGSVRVQRCTVHGFDQPDCAFPPPLEGGHAVDVASCNDVALAGCTLSGGDATFTDISAAGAFGGRGIIGAGSRVALYDCQVSGGAGSSIATMAICPNALQGGYAGPGGPAASFATSPIAFVSNGAFTGGAGGMRAPTGYSGYGACGGPGLMLFSSSNTRVLQSTFAHGTHEIHPSGCTLGDVYAPPPTTFQVLAGSARRISATRVVREGQPARVDVFGLPGDQVRLVFGEAPDFEYSDTWRGVRLVRRPRPGPVALVGTIGPSGTLSDAWIVPDLGPGVQSRRLFLQAELVDPSGQKTMSTPATLVLVDSAF